MAKRVLSIILGKKNLINLFYMLHIGQQLTNDRMASWERIVALAIYVAWA
jgi:hypothetical protein